MHSADASDRFLLLLRLLFSIDLRSAISSVNKYAESILTLNSMSILRIGCECELKQRMHFISIHVYKCILCGLIIKINLELHQQSSFSSNKFDAGALDVIDCVPSQVLSKIVSSSGDRVPDAQAQDCPCPSPRQRIRSQESPSPRSAHYPAHVTRHNGMSHSPG